MDSERPTYHLMPPARWINDSQRSANENTNEDEIDHAGLLSELGLTRIQFSLRGTIFFTDAMSI